MFGWIHVPRRPRAAYHLQIWTHITYVKLRPIPSTLCEGVLILSVQAGALVQSRAQEGPLWQSEESRRPELGAAAVQAVGLRTPQYLMVRSIPSHTLLG